MSRQAIAGIMAAMSTDERRRWAPFQHLGRALLLIVVLAAGIPFSPLVALGPQQQVRHANPKMGIHTRLTDEVEPWKIKRTLEMVREMGTPWIVEYFPWAYYEPVSYTHLTLPTTPYV